MGLQHMRVLKTRKFCRGERCEKLLQALWLPLIQPRDFFPAVWIWCVSSLLNMIVGKLALIFILPVSKSLWTVPRCCVADHPASWWKDKRFWWGLSEFCFRCLKAYSTPTGQNFRQKIFDATLSCLERKGAYVSRQSHRKIWTHLGKWKLESLKLPFSWIKFHFLLEYPVF